MRLFVSAIEASSNLHLKELLNYGDDVELCGAFSKELGEPLYDAKEFSVMGFLDVLPKILKAREAIKELAFVASECDQVLLIDAPAFNIPLARAIKKLNPTSNIVYYILPKAWAWKPKRIEMIEKYADTAVSIFPFEKKFYTNSVYFGNPILDEITNYKMVESKTNIIAFLPGSRKSEIKALMPVYRAVSSMINKTHLLVIPSHFSDLDIKKTYGDISDFEVVNSTKEALIKSEFAYVCSGTATLEAAVIGTPFVLVYKVKKIDYFIGRLFVKLQHVGLANIIFDFEGIEPFHDELLQKDVNPKNLYYAYKYIKRQSFIEKSKKLRDILKSGGLKELSKILFTK